MSVINTNLQSIVAQNALSKNSMVMRSAMQRLSTGLRINSSADDAAGLAISTRMTANINGMSQAVRNANDGINVAQTADGALSTITDTLQSMRTLAVQASNSGALSTGDRTALNTQFQQLQKEVKRQIDSTTFNGKALLAGGLKSGIFQVGAGTSSDSKISVKISNLHNASGIGTAVSGVSIGGSATSANLASAIKTIDAALSKVNTTRTTLGAVLNRFSSVIDNLNSGIQNLTASRSTILDADFSVESANLARSQILSQAGTSMLAQANQSPQSVLALLR
jgi:flagellin